MKKRSIFVLVAFILFGGYFLYDSLGSNLDDYVIKEQFNAPVENVCLTNGGQILDKVDYEVCLFEDNKQCEINALESSECPIGGFKITGYESKNEIYCKITGGEVISGIDKCTKNGHESRLEEYFINTAYENAVKNSTNVPICSDLPEETLNQCRN